MIVSVLVKYISLPVRVPLFEIAAKLSELVRLRLDSLVRRVTRLRKSVLKSVKLVLF